MAPYLLLARQGMPEANSERSALSLIAQF